MKENYHRMLVVERWMMTMRMMMRSLQMFEENMEGVEVVRDLNTMMGLFVLIETL